MKHPALEQKIESFRYDKLYARYAWRIAVAGLLISAHFLLLLYIAFGAVLGKAVMGVLACAGLLLTVAAADHFGAELARERLARQGKQNDEIAS